MPCLQPFRDDSAQLLLFKIASCLEANGGGAGVTSFNGLTGAVTGVISFNGRDGVVILSQADVAAVADGRYVLKAGDTMTGALVHPDGTAALPSITFTGDLDTGIYHPAANTVGLTAGGSLILATSTTGINLTTALAYQYNSVNVIRAQTALSNYFFGPSGNLTMTGTNNVAIGLSALLSNTTGANNIAIGTSALSANTTGANNFGIGVNALMSNIVGDTNTAVGTSALRLNTGSGNVAIGSTALTNNTSGALNTAIGVDALGSQTTADGNSAVGRLVLFDVTSGGGNTGLGHNTGRGITTGTNNTILGANVTGLAAGLSNNIIIADGAGNQRINVISSGFVGIGTTAPATLFANTSTAQNDGATGVGSLTWTLASAGYVAGFVNGLAAINANGVLIKTADVQAGTKILQVSSGANISRLSVSGDGAVLVSTSLTLATAAPLSMTSGANQRAGDVVLVAGTVTTANTTVTANTRVYTSRRTAGGVLGNLTYTIIAATSFTITSDNIADTSTVSYLLIEVP